jgi:hypothetical protein
MWTAMAVKRRMYAKDIFFGNSDLDVFSGQMVVVGTLLHGQPSGLVGYFNSPRYRASRFAAAQDDRLDIWVGCEDGDAIAWVLDTNYRTLAWNDDARVGITNSHISLTIPSTQPVFYLVFREYNLQFSHFRVELNWRGRQPPGVPARDLLQPDLAVF